MSKKPREARESVLEKVSAERRDALRRLVADGDRLVAFNRPRRVTELQPDDAESWYRLGDLAQGLGRRQDAREAYEHYRDLLTEPDTTIDMILVSLRGEAPPARASNACVRQLFETFAKTYDSYMVEHLHDRSPSLLMDAIKNVRPDLQDADVLDIGCGTGRHGELLRPLARRLVGIDLSEAMTAHARARNIYDAIEVVEITSYLARPDAGLFDLLSASDVFIYFGDLRQVLEPAAAHLTPGGLLGFTTEESADYPFKLTDSGRFAHHERHVSEVAHAVGLSVSSIDRAILRYEYGEAVKGLVVVLRKR